jgi:hypothetical protein
MEELHTDSIDGGHEASYGARSRARERAYFNNKKIGSIVFGMAYLIFRFSKSSSSSFNKLMYYYYKTHSDRLFFYIDKFVSIVVGKFYIFDFFFFLRCLGKKI